nr:DNA-directed DNA polymerase [Tanacetum cinerariifolium]
MCDASDFAIGAVLGQHKTKHFQPIHYASKTMTEAQMYYTKTKKEMLAVVYAFEKFQPYLVLSKSKVYRDHSALKYLLNKQVAKPRIIRWVLLLQEFDIIIRDKKGSKNLAADHSSRLENPHKDVSENKDINENFPLETLGVISSESTSWFADYANFHAGNFIVIEMSSQQKKKFFKDTSGQVEVSNCGLKRILERTTAGDHRKLQLNKLNELHDQAYENERTKKLHDSKIKNCIFNIGDRVLLFNSRLKIFSGKLKTRWSGPFTINKVFPYGTVELSQPDGPNFKVNGHRVKHYFKGDVQQLEWILQESREKSQKPGNNGHKNRKKNDTLAIRVKLDFDPRDEIYEMKSMIDQMAEIIGHQRDVVMMRIKMKNPPLDQTGGRGSKRRREGKEPESTSDPKEKATKTTGKSTQGDLAKQADSRSSFNELMDTPVDFLAFLMNRLKVDTLTPELLAGLTYELMKGSCKSLVELEFFLEEVYKATTDQLDWNNPEGQQYPHNLLKPIPLIPSSRGRRIIPFDHFINNDLEYLRGGASSRKYTTSVTKTKAADYRNIKWIKDLVPRTMWSQKPSTGSLLEMSTQNVESSLSQIFRLSNGTITSIWIGLRCVEMMTSYKSSEKAISRGSAFKTLKICYCFWRVEDLQLGVESYQKKLNLTKPDMYHFDLKRKEAYTAYSNPRGFIYQNKEKKNTLMRID